MSSRSIVIIGGSFGGYGVAKELAKSAPDNWTVTLVEKSHYHHDTFAFPRYSVVSGYEDGAFVPLAKRSIKGTERLNVIFEECTDLTGKDVILKSGATIPYTYLVIATGRLQMPPGNLLHTDKPGAINELKGFQKSIKDSKTIAVVGAGACGIELATDIKSFYGNAKVVDLYSSREHILPRFDQRVAELAEPVLRDLGVNVFAKCRPTVNGNEVTLPSGQVKHYDTVFYCAGERPVESPFANYLGNLVSPKGHLAVNEYFQVNGDNIFAIGDVNDVGPKIAVSAMLQATCVSENIFALIKGNPLTEYVHSDLENSCHLTLGTKTDLNFMPGKDPVLVEHEPIPKFDTDRIWTMFDVDPTNK